MELADEHVARELVGEDVDALGRQIGGQIVHVRERGIRFVHDGDLAAYALDARVMVGDPGPITVANAHAMGVRGFDADSALALMRRSAEDVTRTQREDLGDWLALHYVDNAAASLEYAMADFAIAQMAGALGDAQTRDQYLTRSRWWRRSA